MAREMGLAMACAWLIPPLAEIDFSEGNGYYNIKIPFFLIQDTDQWLCQDFCYPKVAFVLKAMKCLT